MLFKCIRSHEICCFCVSNLKVAAYMISVFGIVDGIHSIVVATLPPCSHIFKLDQALDLVRWCSLAIHMVYLFASVGLIIAVWQEYQIYFDLYIITVCVNNSAVLIMNMMCCIVSYSRDYDCYRDTRTLIVMSDSAPASKQRGAAKLKAGPMFTYVIVLSLFFIGLSLYYMVMLNAYSHELENRRFEEGSIEETEAENF